MSFPRALIIACICTSLAACGFSLRSNDVLTSKFSALRLDLQQPGSELATLLRRNLEIAEVNTESGFPNQQNAVPMLTLSAERLLSRPVSVNPRARAAQYELRLSVDASLTLEERVLFGPETLVVERSYFEDIENISGNQEELAIISTEMRRDLINQLMRRLEAVEI